SYCFCSARNLVTKANPERSGDAKPTGLSQSAGLPKRGKTTMSSLGKTTLKVGLTVGFTLGAIVGLVGCADQTEDVENHEMFGVGTWNGVITTNGIYTGNGVITSNGINSINGINTTNGITSQNGIMSSNGVSTLNGVN